MFRSLADNAVNVDMIIQNLQRDELNDITFTINQDQERLALKVLENIKSEIRFNNYSIDRDVAKISIVGAGMQSTPGIAARMFTSLGENNINIGMITTSEIKISCLIKKNDANKALNVLHQEFKLDKINE
jgi:aspartate kinase